MLPDWAGQRIVHKPGPKGTQFSFPLRTGWKARGWQLESVSYSSIPDPQYPYDPDVWEAIKEFWPEARYVGITKIYRAPYEDSQYLRCKFFHHCIGSYISNPHQDLAPFYVRQASDDDEEPANLLGPIISTTEHYDDDKGLPLIYHPLDWEAYYYLRSIYEPNLSVRQTVHKYIRDPLRREAKEADDAKEDFNGWKEEVDKYWLKVFNSWSDVEQAEYNAYVLDLRRREEIARRTGVMPQSERTPKVFVSRRDN